MQCCPWFGSTFDDGGLQSHELENRRRRVLLLLVATLKCSSKIYRCGVSVLLAADGGQQYLATICKDILHVEISFAFDPGTRQRKL